LGLTRKSSEEYIDSLRAYGMRICIWPPVDESLYSGRKGDVVELLDQVAKETTKTARPWTRRLTPESEVPPGSVVKREFSDCGHHVLFHPTNANGSGWWKDKTRSDKTLHRWLVQKGEPLLKNGEWRIFFVGGLPVYRIWTQRRWEDNDGPYGMWKTHGSSDHPGIYSLEELR
jgi:hypothetical protein